MAPPLPNACVWSQSVTKSFHAGSAQALRGFEGPAAFRVGTAHRPGRGGAVQKGHNMSGVAAGVTVEDPAAVEEAGLAARVAALEAEGAALNGALAGEAAALEVKRRLAAAAAAERDALELKLGKTKRDAERNAKELDTATWRLALHRALQAAKQNPAWRDWAGGLPDEVLETVAGKVVAQTEAGWAARLKRLGCSEWGIQTMMAERERDGNCLFLFARVCKHWRKAQLKVGGPLRTRVRSDVIAPGQVELAKWALAEGCPMDDGDVFTMANAAAADGQLELVKWLCGEGGFLVDEDVMVEAASSGNLKLVQWMRGEGCPWDHWTCQQAVHHGHVEVLRWARENGCPWDASTRNNAAAKLGYTDNFGNTVDTSIVHDMSNV